MSLKAFHVFFVSVSIILTVGFGVWAVQDYQRHDNTMNLGLGIGSFVFAGILVIYGVWFLKKLKNVSYL